MKLSASTLLLSMLLGAHAHEGKMNDIRSKRRLTTDFMKAMKEPAIEAARQKGRGEKIRKLHENLMTASRKLENYQSNYQNYQNEAYSGQQNNYYAQENGYASGYYADGVYYPWEAAPFDMTSRAFKYSGCAAIKTYDSDRAYETGDPMVVETYAVFRLCPADSCNDYSMTGCGKNYGEYAVEMKTYLSYVLGFYDERFEEYCDYCEPCDWEYQAEAKSTLSQCYAMQQYYANGGADQQNNADANNANNANANNANTYNADNNNANGYNNYQKYYNGANYGGGRQLNYYSNNANNNNANYNQGNANYNQGNANYNQGQYNQNQYNAQQQAYGYYDENGEWVDAAEEVAYGSLVECKDGSMCDQCTYNNEQVYDSCDDYICGDYYTYCSDLYGELQDDFDPMDYLECQGFKNDYGQQYYIGPHCGTDHYTISLGVFSDENCLEYVGDSVSLSTVLGFTYSNDDVFKLPKECISCDGAEEYAELQTQNQGRYGDYFSAPMTTQDGVIAMCGALYTLSAQCNMHMNNFESISRYMSQYELDTESRYCSFISNIVYGAYDESGEILLQPEQFDFADWQNPHQYKKLRMPASQAVGLAFSIVIFVALFASAAVTQRQLTRPSTPWKPSREDVALARQNSGILMGRSRSGPGAAPLI